MRILVTGGVRSGKSTHAEALLDLALAGAPVNLALLPPGDRR